ncbi:MAG: serine/threonine protein kinase [Mycobacteriaceae bacterium]|nr:serine/threonine protein kinase [Mycobacteriaceae bacterium]
MEGTPFGRYRLIDLLGRGGMGEVWKAFDTATQRVVAVKVLPAQLAADPVFEQRFRREAFTAASLSEPHVVPIHNFGEIDGRLYVDMRLIEGEDLQHVLAEGPLDAARAVKVIEQVASALNAAHRAGLVHRDVKPSNILLAEDDFAYLIDFGIARGAGETGLTGTGNVIGTWPYMAPERFSTGRSDKSSDIYALACVLYECLTAKRPFPGESVEQQIAGHLTTPPPRASIARPEVTPQLDSVIATGMAKDPDQRYNSTTDLARAARAALTEPLTKPLLPPDRTMPGQEVLAPTRRVGGVARPREWGGPGSTAYPAPPASSGPSAPSGASAPAAPTRARLSRDRPGPATPTYARPAEPPAVVPPPEPPAPEAARQVPWWQRRAIVIPIAVLLMLGAVATILTVLMSKGKSPSAPSTANGGFNGTYAVDFGAATRPDGQPYENAPGGRETWVIQSACASSGCVATASRLTGTQSMASTLVLDKIGQAWTSVSATSGTCQNAATEYWESMSLQQRQDGSLSGEFVVRSTTSCARNQQVTFTRTGDVQPNVSIADPRSQPPRVASPAQGLHGRYQETDAYAADNKSYALSFDVQTYCLRTGERCLSVFVNPDRTNAFIFQQNTWTLTTTSSDVDCKSGGSGHQDTSLTFPLPQPAADPITLLTGHGHNNVTGACPYSSDFDAKLERTGD